MSISVEDAEEYTQAAGQVFAGGWRFRALAWRLGVPQALGMSLEDWTEKRLGGYVRLSIPERREAVAELASEGMTQPEIAEVLGVNQGTVSRDLNPRPRPDMQMHTLEPEGVEESQVVNPEPRPDMQMHTLEPEGVEPEHHVCVGPAGGECFRCGSRIPPAPTNQGDEWYTPSWLFDALGIDKFWADVCAPLDRTHSAVPAERHFTIEDDGLAQPWDGIVWCNPPYSKPEPWARRMIHHRDGGLLLTHIPMNAGWCVDMWEVCDGIRLFQAMEFVRPDGSSQRPGYWLQLAAFGPVATAALARLQPLGDAAHNKRRVASPMWRRAA